MSEVFYRKYRPKNFSEIIGQEHLTSVLKQAIANYKTAHAYLFSGPRGTGKTSTARLLAKALNCTDFGKNQDVCGECNNCRNADAGTGLNIIEIDAASNRGINEIRQLRESISYSSGSSFKTYIIDEVHMLTAEAFNALLKTLEEPPQHVVFILATTELHKVPPTILSRVQHFQFRLGNKENVLKKLEYVLSAENYSAEPAVLDLLFELADGGYRDAESLLGKLITNFSKDNTLITEQEAYTILGLPAKQQVSNLITSLLNGNSMGAIQQIEVLDQVGINWQYFIRALLNDTKQQIIQAFAKNLPTNGLTEVLRLLAAVYVQLKEFPSPKLALETEILLKASPASLPTATQAGVNDKSELTEAPTKKAQIIKDILNRSSSASVEIVNPAYSEDQSHVANDFDLTRFLKLVQPKLGLAQVLNAIKLEWKSPKLTIKPDTTVQVAALKKELPLLTQALRKITNENSEVEIIDADKLKSIVTSQVKAVTAARESQTNAKLVEELF